MSSLFFKTSKISIYEQKLFKLQQYQYFATIFVNLINTLTSRLIQVVRKKTAGSHVALRGNISAPVWVTDLVETSKDAASLVVCTLKKFFGWWVQVFCE